MLLRGFEVTLAHREHARVTVSASGPLDIAHQLPDFEGPLEMMLRCFIVCEMTCRDAQAVAGESELE